MRLIAVALTALVTISVAAWPSMAALQTYTLNPGDSLQVTCSTVLSGTVATNSATLDCAAPTATATPVPPTPVPNTGACGESNDMWHPPVVNGCATGHEHGDAPPAWLTSAGYMPMFTHPGNTPNENIIKHTSFKGFSARLNNVDLYVVMHLDGNPSGHTSRFHSYQMWARDPSGGISHWDGWLDFGPRNTTQTGPNLRRKFCDDDTVRPIMSVNSLDPGCTGPLQFESWYSQPAGYLGNANWMPDFGFNFSANYYNGCDPADQTTWAACATGGNNGTRRMELAWYAGRSGQRGSFYATNFGQIVSGPTDPLCGTTNTVGTKTYPVLCIQQYIAPSMTSVQFPGNAVQKTYDMTGVHNPN